MSTMAIFRRTALALGLITAAGWALLGGGALPAEAGWPQGFSVATANIGGTYYIWLGGWSRIVSGQLGRPASVEVTGGAVSNLQLVESGETTFGGSTTGPLYDGWNGTGWAKGKRYRNVRALFGMYSSYWHGYAIKKSGIRSVHDLQGKRVSLGPAGGTPDVYGRMLLAGLGVKPAQIVNLGWESTSDQMKDGLLDACLAWAGIPQASILELETTHPVTVFGLSEPDIQQMVGKLPFLFRAILPRGTYKSAAGDLPTVALGNYVIAHKDLDPDFVYHVLKATFDKRGELLKVHRSASETRPESIARSVIPVHVGAIRYYAEKGVAIPVALVPPESRR